jgi:signal transduction histidine kinase
MLTDTSLLESLAAHRTIGGIPREQLEWLAKVGHLRTLEAGYVLTAPGNAPGGMFIVLDGHLSIRVNRGAGSHIVMEWHGGDVTGLLPYSRIKTPPGEVVAERQTVILVIDPPHIPHMIRECHELTEILVHVMIDRARAFKSSELLDEKMVSLGKLSAGLAHELNNPASAVARSAKTLVAELERLDAATRQVCQLNLSDTQFSSVVALRDEHRTTPVGRSPLETADSEDALADWLDEHHVSGVPVEQLAASAFEPSDLEKISGAIGSDKMAPVLAHIASGQTARRLAEEINSAATRIHALVDAVKGFTYMDQQAALKPVEISRGLSDTITVLGAKAKANSVDVRLEIPKNLPSIDGYGGELNQVWLNLLDNAIDATPKGHVRVTANVEAGKLVVRIIDDGSGIPADLAARIFDPFFTTKEVGEGTGLGLDIARRIVDRHHGEIDLTSNEHGTEFRVTLPLSQAVAPKL